MRALAFDDAIYQAAGLNPLPLNLSPAMTQVLVAGLQRTQGTMRNLTLTSAIDAQNLFTDAADLAYMQVSSGAFDYNTAIRQAVESVAEQGLGVIHYASGRREHLDVAMRRAVLTGVNQTAGQLQWARADEMGCDLVETSAHIGARNTGTGPANHEGWQGRVFSRSGKHPKYPDFVAETGYGTGPGLCGWNCVIGETRVSGPPARAGYRREYSGELVIIKTASGKELTITPNHPILTDHGWIAAGLLNVGDRVISRGDSYGTETTSPDTQQGEPRIEDVFSSLSESGKLFRFLGSTGYFHGDISDGEIDVVFPKGFLRDRGQSTLNQQWIESALSFACQSPSSFSTLRPLTKVFNGACHSPDSVMSSFGQGGASISPSPFHPLTDRIRAAFSNRNTHLSEVLSDQTLRNSDLFSDFVFPETGVIHTQEFIWSDARLSPQIDFPVSWISDSVSLDGVLNSMNGATVLVGDALISFTGHEAFDDIVFIERKYLSSTHVYNLETKGGWYFANGIITHNCRHSFFPFYKGVSERFYDEAGLKDLADRTVIYNGKEIPVYEATQKQRAIEREIRAAKREAGALKAAGLDNTEELARVRDLQGKMRDFTRQTGLSRQYQREQALFTPKLEKISKTGMAIDFTSTDP